MSSLTEGASGEKWLAVEARAPAARSAEQLMPPCVQAAQRWIRYAMQHLVKSLVLELDLPLYYIDDKGADVFLKRPLMTLDDLASSAKLETMYLVLGDVRLQLPSTAVFASLTDLSLENMELEAGGGHLIARLVSSACCPRLRRLRLVELILPGMQGALLIDAAPLMELTVEIGGLRLLELRTPSLEILRVKGCYSLEELTISALRLQNLEFLVQHPLHIYNEDALSSIERLKIQLLSYRYLFDGTNNGSIRLLECCRLTRYLEVSLRVPKRKKQYVDLTKSRIPHLPHLTSLTIYITLWSQRCSYTDVIASFLAQCNNIRYLSLRLFCYTKEENDSEFDLSCDNSDPCKSHELCLAHLQEVELKKLMGTEEDLQFIRFILTRASGIQKVVISFDQKFWTKGTKDGFRVLLQVDDGSWTTCDDALLYKWTRCVRVHGDQE